MKRCIALVVAVGAQAMAAQLPPAAGVPPAVQQALLAKFSGVKSATWSVNSARNYIAEFHRGAANYKVALSPSTGWLETATEISALTLPEVVRRAIVRAYSGFQFVTTWRVVRATNPTELFEIHLAKLHEQVVVRYDVAGNVFTKHATVDAPPPTFPVAGMWRGESICLVATPGCTADTVLFRVMPVANDSSAFDIMMNKVVGDNETVTNTLACTLDRRRDRLVCIARPGMWEFKASKDSLSGGLALDGGVAARRVSLWRVP